MHAPEFAVWEWLDEDGLPVYVGIGRVIHGEHPAAILWDKVAWSQRGKVDSPLNRWLLTHKKEPKRGKELPTPFMYQADAQTLAHNRREFLKARGFTLLLARPYGTHKGGGAARAVISPCGDVYVSVRAAARELNLNHCAVVRWCNDSENGWTYLQ